LFEGLKHRQQDQGIAQRGKFDHQNPISGRDVFGGGPRQAVQDSAKDSGYENQGYANVPVDFFKKLTALHEDSVKRGCIEVSILPAPTQKGEKKGPS
jgi:hypothetical protein